MSDQREQPLTETERAIVQAVNDLSTQARATANYIDKLTEFVINLDARTSGTEAVAAIVDENQTEVEAQRIIDAQKELITHLFEKSHQYVTLIVAGAFAAYFATFSAVSERYSSEQLLLSAGLMTFSLTVFVLWEIVQISFISWSVVSGNLGKAKSVPRWQQVGWGVSLFMTLGTGIPAMVLALWSYITGLGVF